MFGRGGHHQSHCGEERTTSEQGFVSRCALIVTVCLHLLLEDMAPSAVTTYGSHLNSSRDVMVHWPTTGFLPNGRWSITFSTMGGVYISSLGRSWVERMDKMKLPPKHLSNTLMHDVLLPLPLWWRGPSWGSWGSFSCSWWRLTPPSVLHIPPPGSAKTLRPAGTVSCSSDPMPESGYRDAHRVDHFLRYDIYQFRMTGSKVVCYLHSSELHHRTDPLWNHVEVLCSLWGNQRKIWLPRLQRHEKSWVPELFWDTVKGACSPLLCKPCLEASVQQPPVPPQPSVPSGWWDATGV